MFNVPTRYSILGIVNVIVDFVKKNFTKVFFTKSYIHGTDCHFTYVVFRTNLSLNTKSPIFYGVNYLIVLELAFLHFNSRPTCILTTMFLNMFITLNFILHDTVFIYNIVRLYLGIWDAS